jgi:hypothetical protein
VNFAPGEARMWKLCLKPCLPGLESPCVTRAGQRCGRSSRAARPARPGVHSRDWALVGGTDDVLPRVCGRAGR